MNNLEFALEMKNKHLASALSQGELARLTHVSRYSIKGKPFATYHTTYTTPYILHKTGKQEHESIRFTVYHGAFKYQYHNELVCSCVHRYCKIRGSASNRIEVFTTILTTLDSENIRR